MSLNVVWTDEAQETFDNIINLLEDKWGERSASEFAKNVQSIVKLIAIQPYLFKVSSIPDCRQVVITKQTSMFYAIQNQNVVVLFFYDNRQNPIF